MKSITIRIRSKGGVDEEKWGAVCDQHGIIVDGVSRAAAMFDAVMHKRATHAESGRVVSPTGGCSNCSNK